MTYFIAFFGVMLLDILYIVYTKSLIRKNLHGAAITSGLIAVSTGLMVINYSANHWSILVGGLGGILGTYIGDFIDRKFL